VREPRVVVWQAHFFPQSPNDNTANHHVQPDWSIFRSVWCAVRVVSPWSSVSAVPRFTTALSCVTNDRTMNFGFTTLSTNQTHLHLQFRDSKRGNLHDELYLTNWYFNE
jgi:hypothetical protein